MRILLLTQWFDPEPVFKGLVFARELQLAGHEVEVITGFPNYPGGILYSGYTVRWWETTIVEGVRVTRVPLYPSHDSSVIARAANYVSFALSSCVYGCLVSRKPDVMYVYHPPMTVGVSGSIIGALRRVPFVIDINDLWPDSLSATGMVDNARVLSLLGMVCRWVYKRAGRIVVGTPGIRDLLIKRGVPPGKLDVIYNWSDEQALRLPAVSEHNGKRAAMASRFNVVFAGNMGKAQALAAVITAAKRVESVEPQVQFVFVGGGVEVEHLKELTEILDVGNVLFIPRMPMSEVGSVLAAADVLLIHLKDEPLFRITIPSKLQAYMAIGKPILMAVDGDAATIVKRSKCGVLADPEDADSIASAAVALFRSDGEALRRMGERGRRYYDEHLSLHSGVARFTEIFEQLSDSAKEPG